MRRGPPGYAYLSDEPPGNLRQAFDDPEYKRTAHEHAFLEALRLRRPLSDTPVRSFELANIHLRPTDPIEMHLAQAYHQGAPVVELESVITGELLFATLERFLVAVAIVAMPLPALVTSDIDASLDRVQRAAKGTLRVRERRELMDSPFFYPALEKSWGLFDTLPPTTPHPGPTYSIWAPAPQPLKYLYRKGHWGNRVANPRYVAQNPDADLPNWVKAYKEGLEGNFGDTTRPNNGPKGVTPRWK